MLTIAKTSALPWVIISPHLRLYLAGNLLTIIFGSLDVKFSLGIAVRRSLRSLLTTKEQLAHLLALKVLTLSAFL